ncbi:hypothetical protein NHF46_22100 [Arthrobacter alpinus]|nr:hypothetical protein [Arthrobacter alpinus]
MTFGHRNQQGARQGLGSHRALELLRKLGDGSLLGGIGFNVGPPQFPHHKQQQDHTTGNKQFADDLDEGAEKALFRELGPLSLG